MSRLVNVETGADRTAYQEARDLTDRIRAAFVSELMRPASTSERSPKRDDRDVYFIAATTSCLVKIGVAANPAERLKQLTTMSPEPLELVGVIRGVGQAGEIELHNRLARSRSHGEWFYPTGEVMATVMEALL